MAFSVQFPVGTFFLFFHSPLFLSWFGLLVLGNHPAKLSEFHHPRLDPVFPHLGIFRPMSLLLYYLLGYHITITTISDVPF